MKVIFSETVKGSVTGVDVKEYLKGETYDLHDSLIRPFVTEMKVAKPVSTEIKKAKSVKTISEFDGFLKDKK